MLFSHKAAPSHAARPSAATSAASTCALVDAPFVEDGAADVLDEEPPPPLLDGRWLEPGAVDEPEGALGMEAPEDVGTLTLTLTALVSLGRLVPLGRLVSIVNELGSLELICVVLGRGWHVRSV